MSDATTDPQGTEGQDFITLGSDPGAAMEAIMGFLAPETDTTSTAGGEAADGAAGANAGQSAAAGEGAGAAGAAAGAPAGGDAGKPPVPNAGSDGAAAGGSGATVEGGAGQAAGQAGAAGAPPGSERDGGAADPEAASGLDAEQLTDYWSTATQTFEDNQVKALEDRAFTEAQEQHKAYFDALRQHPRLLVGRKVPRADGGEGEETLRDSRDAEEWQAAVKHALITDINVRVEELRGELASQTKTVHDAIDLFRNNADLIPGTKQFDGDLAKQFTQLAKPYEVRNDKGKLTGYSIAVQPMIDHLRSQLKAQAASAPAAQPSAQQQQPAPTPQQQRAAEQPRTPQGQFDGPQGGIQSKAGSSGGGGDNVAAGVMDAFLRQAAGVAL